MPAKSVKLGLMPPLTGLVGIYGSEIARAGQIACQEVNENGGVLGRPLELVVEDDGSLPESAVAAASRLVDQHRCAAIIGNLLSNSRIAVAYRVAEPRKIPYLNFSFYEGSILSRYFFHFAALPNQQIDRMIPYMREKYGPRMFFAGNNYEWPRGSIDAAKRALVRAGGEVVGEEYCPIGVDSGSIEHLLDQVAEAAPDVFVPYFAGADQVNLLTRFTRRGLKKRMAVVMGHYDEMMASKLSPEVREGFYSSNTYFMTVDSAENRNYLARLATQSGVNGIWPHGNGVFTNFGEGTYICVKAFAHAANEAGSLDPEALVDVLKTIHVSGPQGIVRMDPVTHHATVNTYLSRCEADGVFTIVEKFGAINPILPERYNHQRISHQATLEDDIRLQARMLEQMSEAVFLVNTTNGAIVYANAGADRMLGYDKGGLIGKHVSSLNAPSDKTPQETAADIVGVLAQKGRWQGEIRNIRKDGTTIWCSSSVSAFTHPVYGEVWMGVNRDITQLKTLQQELERHRHQLEQLVLERTDRLTESERQLRRAQEIAKIGHWSVNLVSGELAWSDEIFRIFGRDKRHFQPSYDNFFVCVHPDDRPLVKESEQVSFTTGHHSVDHRVVHPDGSIRWVHEEAGLERDATGKPLWLTGTVQDITIRKEAETELIRARDEADRANIAKNIFLSRMSHELRTPMNAILGFAQILELDQLKPEQHEFAREIHRAGDHLLELINELLDLSLIEAGKMATVLQPVNVQAVVVDAVRITQPLIIARQIGFINKCDAHATVLADPTRLKQILVNLLSNAAKYNRTGGRILLDCQARDGDRLRLSVTDTGPGIPPEKLSDLFRPFERLGAEFSAVDGTGIGLALSRQLAELMGGTLGHDNIPGEGSTFWIDLPVVPETGNTEIPALPDIEGVADARQLKVLYVEDNAANRRLVEAMFRHQPQLKLLSAANGELGLELARCHKPDAILLDIHLPGMDGYAVLDILKADAATRAIPVIALSADAMPIDTERGLRAGFFRYLSKPIILKQLMETLDETIKLTRRSDR